jgi:hypothetical protein
VGDILLLIRLVTFVSKRVSELAESPPRDQIYRDSSMKYHTPQFKNVHERTSVLLVLSREKLRRL